MCYTVVAEMLGVLHCSGRDVRGVIVAEMLWLLLGSGSLHVRTVRYVH